MFNLKLESMKANVNIKKVSNGFCGIVSFEWGDVEEVFATSEEECEEKAFACAMSQVEDLDDICY